MEIKTECNLSEIIVEILNGKTLVFPTETSYGLGCDATNQEAVDKIFKIKGRKSDKPLLVVVPTVEMAKKYLKWNSMLDKLAKKYWPGALTVIGEYKRDLSPALSFAKERETRPSPPQRRGQGEVPLTDRLQGEVSLVSNEVSLAGRIKRFFSFERTAGDTENLSFRRQLRQDATKAEKILWQHLRNKRLGGLKFKRQHGIGRFIVDFFHPETRTVIEIDGDIHFVEDGNIKKDKDRELWLEKNGYRVIRYNNVDIFGNLDWILREIYHELAEANATPLSNYLLCEGERVATLASAEERAGRGLAFGVISNDNTVAIRVTSHPLLISITEKIGRPLVATSANLSEAGEIYDAEKIYQTFESQTEQPDFIMNYGILPKHLPTTIIGIKGEKVEILRQGELQVEI